MLLLSKRGLTAEEIIEQVREGATLADVLTSNGGSVDAVVDAVLAEAEAFMSEAVAEERITQEQMDERLAGLSDIINSALNGEFEPRRNGECQLPDGEFSGGQGFGGNGDFPNGNGQGGQGENGPRGNGNGQFPSGNGGQGGNGPCSTITAETDV